MNVKNYYENSQTMLKKGELAKGGELLWGAIAESIKALRLKYDAEPIRSHYQIRNALKEIALSYKKFRMEWAESADLMHVNFYESFMDDESFRANYEKSKMALFFIMRLNEKRGKEKPTADISSTNVSKTD